MDREGGKKERMRKCREWIFLHFLSISSFSLHFLFNFSFSLYFLAARLPQHVHPWLLKLDIEASVSDMQYIAVVVLMSRLPRENLFFWALPELGREDPVLKLNLTLFQKWKFAQLGLQGGGRGVILAMPKRICVFSGKSSLWLTRWSVYHWCIKILWNRSFLGRPVLRYSLLKFVFYLISRSERSKRKISPWAEEKDKNSNNKKSKACTKSFRVFGEVFWRRPIRYINCINCIFCLQNWASR